MQTVYDYLQWRGDLTFDVSPYNEVDGLIFSEIAYLPFDKFVPSFSKKESVSLSDLAKKFFEVYHETSPIGAIIPGFDLIHLFRIAKDTKRYQNVKVSAFVNDIRIQEETQLCAMCFTFGKKKTVVAYRGTDDTIVGWKENFNMAIHTPIPAQKNGCEYLNQIGKKTRGKLYIVGHSKGGNLAVYSALTCKKTIQKRIQSVYSFDGPGFRQIFVDQVKGHPLLQKTTTVMPDYSIVGTIFYPLGTVKIINCPKKDFNCHNAITWSVLGNAFVSAKGFSQTAQRYHDNLIGWVQNMTEEETQRFIEALFNTLTISDATTLTELGTDRIKFLTSAFKVNREDKKVLLTGISSYLKGSNNRRKNVTNKRGNNEKSN